jgi:hypothetical protein
MTQWLHLTSRKSELDTVVNMDHVVKFTVSDDNIILHYTDHTIKISNDDNVDVEPMLLTLQSGGIFHITTASIELEYFEV